MTRAARSLVISCRKSGGSPARSAQRSASANRASASACLAASWPPARARRAGFSSEHVAFLPGFGSDVLQEPGDCGLDLVAVAAGLALMRRDRDGRALQQPQRDALGAARGGLRAARASRWRRVRYSAPGCGGVVPGCGCGEQSGQYRAPLRVFSWRSFRWPPGQVRVTLKSSPAARAAAVSTRGAALAVFLHVLVQALRRGGPEVVAGVLVALRLPGLRVAEAN